MSAFKNLQEKALGLAKRYLVTEAELLTVLMEMKKTKVFVALNYVDIYDFCLRALKLSRAQSYYFKSVAEKSEEIPEIKTAIDQGQTRYRPHNSQTSDQHGSKQKL